MNSSSGLARRVGLYLAVSLGAWGTGVQAQPGSQDTNFNALVTSGEIGHSVAVQPDGKVIAAGTFGLLRLLTDGSVDPLFQPPFPSGQSIGAAVLQRDGKVLLTGRITNSAGATLAGILRLNPDGSIDPSFNLDPRAFPDGRVLALQPDGKVVTGGVYFDPDQDEYGSLLRLRPDGSLDPDFDARALNTWGETYALALSPEGKIYFSSYGEFARANPDGSRDGTFQPELGLGPYAALAVQRDAKLIVGQYGDGVGFTPLRRLLVTGADDPEWNAPQMSGGDALVQAILIQPDGKIVAGGNNLESFNGVPNAHLGRLLPDGSTDTTFDTRGDLHFYTVQDLALAPDGKVIVAGRQLHRSDYSAGPGIWRLNNDPELQPELTIQLTHNAGVALELRGQPGATYRLEYREQLSSADAWTPLADLTLSGASATWQDPGWTTSTTRFYRAVSLP